MNAKQEWLECNPRLQIVIESADGPIEPPWMNPEAAFVRVHSWRESAFEIAVTAEARPFRPPGHAQGRRLCPHSHLPSSHDPAGGMPARHGGETSPFELVL